MNNDYCVMCGSYHPLTTNGCGVVLGNVERDYDSWRGGNAIFRPNGNVDEIATAVAYAKSRESAEVERLSHRVATLERQYGEMGTVAETAVARAEAAESKLSQLLAACEKFLKQTTGKSPEEIVAILNGGQQ